VVPRLTEKATARVAVAAVAQRGQPEHPTQLLLRRLGVHLRIPFVKVRLERTDTKETRNWALPNRPVFERVGVYMGDGRMATVRTGDARMAA
jgi:hypothetical protein